MPSVAQISHPAQDSLTHRDTKSEMQNIIILGPTFKQAAEIARQRGLNPHKYAFPATQAHKILRGIDLDHYTIVLVNLYFWEEWEEAEVSGICERTGRTATFEKVNW